MREILCEQRSPEWFAARCGRPTASRFADVMSKLKSGAPSDKRAGYMADLALERLTGALAETFVTPAMQRGTELEEAARQAYCAETGELVTALGFALHDTLDAGCSPDGLVGDDGLIEIKCPANARKLCDLYITRDPAEYEWQIHGQLWITGRAWCDLVVYHPSLPIRPIRIERDEKRISELADGIAAFLAELDQLTNQLRKAAA